ncbi:S41 family peptidase [Candidatus Microgenomates bacterium]|nr:S41 family peptidase [Candidatus Microgenomates bacterium]
MAKIDEEKKPKSFLLEKRPKGLLLFVLGFFIFSLGYWTHFGISLAIQKSLVNAPTPERFKDIDFSSFWDALEKVQMSYVGEIDYKKLVEGAIGGMVGSLGDPFSAYIGLEDVNAFNNELNGTFEGIGAEIGLKEGQLAIIAPLEGSPAERAGIKTGDIVQAIDDYPAQYLSIDKAVEMIRGERGTKVRLTISRASEILEISVWRETINVKSLTYKNQGNGIGYVKITRFDEKTANLLTASVDKIREDNIGGLIIDLRNNPGGYLTTAVEAASQFIRDGVIVTEESKTGEKQELKASGRGLLLEMPIVVLVNEGSASASEIVAGAIKDHKRGIIIGTQTFGKGTVQELRPLLYGGALKITVAKWLTPNGLVIDGNGLSPDIEVKWDGTGEDAQLKKAAEEIDKKIRN